MEKKYEFTDETFTMVSGLVLHRIRAVMSFGDVKAGDLGGFIEKEYNLSQEGSCWVSDYAIVYDTARVYGNARIFENARVYGNARIFENARVYGNARIFENARVYGNSEVYDEAIVGGAARIQDNAVITSERDYTVFRVTWFYRDYLTYTRSNNMWTFRDFYGTSEELINWAYEQSEVFGDYFRASVAYVETLYKMVKTNHE